MNILVELEKLRMKHYVCEDCWYSCPESPEGSCCNELEGIECACRADKHNELLDSIIEHMKENYIKNN